jgi:cell wall-associated NlpC family hydrolase
VYDSAVQRRLPRSTVEQFRIGTKVGRGDLQFGDLVFFNTTGRVPSHVGIYIEDDLFAHASVTRGVTLSSIESSYYRKRFVGARRIVHE